MMTSDGARAVSLAGQVGALAPGEWADLVILDTEGRQDLGEILQRSALAQTVAVMIAGRLASGPPSWANTLPTLDRCAPDPRDLCGKPRVVCGAANQRPLVQLLQQTTYTLDDARICAPASTDDCVVR